MGADRASNAVALDEYARAVARIEPAFVATEGEEPHFDGHGLREPFTGVVVVPERLSNQPQERKLTKRGPREHRNGRPSVECSLRLSDCHFLHSRASTPMMAYGSERKLRIRFARYTAAISTEPLPRIGWPYAAPRGSAQTSKSSSTAGRFCRSRLSSCRQ